MLPDIDYFVVLHFGCCTGKENGEKGRIGRENYLISKLNWVVTIETGQFCGGNNDWILIDKCSCSCATDRSVPSILSHDRERYEMAS